MKIVLIRTRPTAGTIVVMALGTAEGTTSDAAYVWLVMGVSFVIE
jgi:hypothetical protein